MNIKMKERFRSMGLFGRNKRKKNKGKNPKTESHTDTKDETGSKGKGEEATEEKPKKKLFGFGKNKKDGTADSGDTKGLLGGKNRTLLERMQLEESVAAATLDVINDLADSDKSAIRRLDEGLLIVAFTNEMLEDMGLEHSSEEFGSFAEGLKSATIESVTLSADLEDGIVGIIPSMDTLISLEEYDFIYDIDFKWAIVPMDLGDDCGITLLEETVDITKLMDMASNSDIKCQVVDGHLKFDGEGPSSGDIVETFNEVDEPVVDDEPVVVEEPVVDETVAVTVAPEDAGIDDFNTPPEDMVDDDFEESMEDEYNMDEYGDEFDEAFGDDDFDMVFDEGMLDVLAEEAKESANRIAKHTFENTELDLEIDMTLFDDHFDSVTIAKFETKRTDDGELQRVVSKLRQDANDELDRFHQNNITNLRNKFTTGMREIHRQLVDAFDHKDKSTGYGEKYLDVMHKYNTSISDIDRFIAKEVGLAKDEYAEDREFYANNAKREAMIVYDDRYRDGRDKKITSVRNTVMSDLKTQRDINLGELYQDRHTVSRRLLDKVTTDFLKKLQVEYQDISQKEIVMFDSFRKDMDRYLRKHFADEVLRSKASAEKLRQRHEADRVRNEYEQMLSVKTRQLDNQERHAKEALEGLSSKHKEQVNTIRFEYEAMLDKEADNNKEMVQLLKESQEGSVQIGEQKEMELRNRLKLYQDTIKAKDIELGFANKRADRSKKPIIFISIAVAAIALAFGVVAGFTFGAGRTTSFTVPDKDIPSVTMNKDKNVEAPTEEKAPEKPTKMKELKKSDKKTETEDDKKTDAETKDIVDKMTKDKTTDDKSKSEEDTVDSDGSSEVDKLLQDEVLRKQTGETEDKVVK